MGEDGDVGAEVGCADGGSWETYPSRVISGVGQVCEHCCCPKKSAPAGPTQCNHVQLDDEVDGSHHGEADDGPFKH